MRILIADDERPARGELIELLTELLPDAVFTEASSGNEAIELISENPYDLLCIDINLGDMAGTTVGSVAKKLQPSAHIIFATAYSEYAVKAFEIGAIDYILKPFEEARLAQTINRLKTSSATQEQKYLPPNKLALSTEKKIILLPTADIVYIETHKRGSIVHTKSDSIESTLSIGALEQRLVGSSFFRIHKSFLINTDYIHSIFLWQNGSYAMKMLGYEKEPLPIGRNQFKVLKMMFQL